MCVKLLRRGLMLAMSGLFMIGVARGQTVPPPDVHREAVDVAQYPWSAIGKLYNETGGSCTAVIVGSDKVLTAAHCIFNYRTQHFIPPGSLHFLAGYHIGKYTAHAHVASYRIGENFDPLHYSATDSGDWAILTLTDMLPPQIEPLNLSHDLSPSGTKAVIAGYPEDRAFAMTADADCELREPIDDGRLFFHTCRGTSGYSGAPILVPDGSDKVRIAGIQIAMIKGGGTERVLAVPAHIIAQALEERAPSGLYAVNNMAGSNYGVFAFG